MNRKIAIIDDEKELVSALTQLFEPRGFDVVSAYDGVTGLDLIQDQLPDAVILDINLPGKDGRDILLAIKKDDDTRDIPVIMLTGRGESFEIEYGIELGAAKYMVKPYSSADILSAVKSVIK